MSIKCSRRRKIDAATIITYAVEAVIYEDAPAELVWNGIEQKAFKFKCPSAATAVVNV